MTKLSVNINKIAVIRNSRGGNLPDVIEAARRIEGFGAQGITVHPRPDERHIRYSDVRELKRVVTTEFNIEGNPFDPFVELVMEAYAFSLYQSLGVYLSLIVVNCIILGRAEMFASKHGVVDSAIDGAGMGIGFTLAICAMAAIRETLGCGTFCGLPVPWFHENPIGILTMAPGGFFVFGCMIALINKISKGKAIKKKEFGCAGCPGCGKASCSGKEAAAK